MLVASGFRAAPGLATLVAVLNLLSRVGLMLAPVAVGAFVTSAAHHDGHALVIDAVLVAVTMQTAEATAPELGGVVRVLASRRSEEPALLVFEGRSPAHIPDEDARLAAAELLEAISSLAAGREFMAEVA